MSSSATDPLLAQAHQQADPPPCHPSHRPVPPPPPPLPPPSARLPSTHPDRGTGWWGGARARLRAAALVEAGRHAGRPAVVAAAGPATAIVSHAWRVDPAAALLALSWPGMLASLAGLYLATFAGFGGAWWALQRAHPTCVAGWEVDRTAGSVLSSFLLSVETQQTIGYGYRSPRACAGSAALVACQAVVGQLLTASCAALIFARLAAPRRRARSVFVSETACVARRDGALTLTFRVGDSAALSGGSGGGSRRRRRALPPPPTVTAHLFTWSPRGSTSNTSTTPPPPLDGPAAGPGTPGAGSTAEGSPTAWSVDELVLEGGRALPPLLLPLTVEHVIDAASPLHGHTPASLARCGAEIVVQVVGVSETGQAWAATRSYLGSELAWGCGFDDDKLVRRALPGEAAHTVDLSRFHEVRPLPAGVGGGGAAATAALTAATPPVSPTTRRLAPAATPAATLAAAAAAVLAPPPPRGALPLRAKPGRSLVLSDALVIGPCPAAAAGAGGGAWLAVRVGDTRGCVVRARARFTLRWCSSGSSGTPAAPRPPIDLPLVCARPGLAAGPAVVGHALAPGSPLGDSPTAFEAAVGGDKTTAVLDVTLDGWDLGACRTVRVSRSYALPSSVAAGFTFAPAVVEDKSQQQQQQQQHQPPPPPRPAWAAFHSLIPAAAGPWPAGARPAAVPAGVPGGPAAAGRV
jgi:hypothetical protein